ncbi:MAG: Fe-S cluster assembly ATPase SufC [bacterium]|nr:Fe-S cluster assembly ATPase SufC [bacterium]
MNRELQLQGLRVKIANTETEILKGVDLTIRQGEIHAMMGPNGAGKSTLGATLLGHPNYEITAGSIHWQGTDVAEMSTDERARAGLFLAFQYPVELPGVSMFNFLRTSYNAMHPPAEGQKPLGAVMFHKKILDGLDYLEMDQAFSQRYLNDGFSGGEKKRCEVLQMMMLKPKMAILDETDSGLDIDALKIVAKGVNSLRSEEFGALVITHYQRLLDYIKPDYVHVLMQGRIVRSGGPELAFELEERGYDWLREEAGVVV